jgi:S1-C subfamily serine protease
VTLFHLGRHGYGAAVTAVHEAKIVGRDEGRDLALLVFETHNDVSVARLGDSDTIHVGDLAVAIGSPVGVAPSVTTGIVSAVGRRTTATSGVAEFTEYIQTDAAINRWNSGGALVNIRGEVIGINSWIASPFGGGWGVGFAIPINNAKTAIDDLITKGRVEYGWIGVSMGTPSDQLKSAMGINRAYGAFVFNVFRNSPSHRAGVLPGDFVVRVGDESVRDPNHLLYMVANLTPGTTIRLDLLRYGNRRSVMVRIAARDEEMEIADRTERIWPGLAISPISDVLRNQLRLGRNAGDVMVGAVMPGSPADTAGFRPGDIVQKINDRDIRSVMDFYRMLNTSRGRREIIVYREGTRISVDLAE